MRKMISIIIYALAFLLVYILYPRPAQAYQKYENKDAAIIAKVIYKEARGVGSRTEQAAVAWCILNRVDVYGSSIEETVGEPEQFAWNSDAPIMDEFYDLACDVLLRWEIEKVGISSNSGRVLPKEYLYFVGDGISNHFTKEYQDRDYWNWSLESPYRIIVILED